jgi:hypothetical protein
MYESERIESSMNSHMRHVACVAEGTPAWLIPLLEAGRDARRDDPVGQAAA